MRTEFKIWLIVRPDGEVRAVDSAVEAWKGEEIFGPYPVSIPTPERVRRAVEERTTVIQAGGPDLEHEQAIPADTTVIRALREYATTAPLDLQSAGQTQRDLLAIAGWPHPHRASIGSDACLICGRDLRNEIHRTETEEDETVGRST